MSLKASLKKNYFLIGIVLVLVFAFFWPRPGVVFKEIGLFSPLTFLLMFLSGLGLPFARIRDSLKDYRNIIYSFLAVFLIFPVVTYLLYNILHIAQGDLYVGAMILAVQSSTLSSAVILTMTANGNVPLALIITIINNISSAFLSPILLKLFLGLNKSISFNTMDMIIKLIIILVLPVILAQIIRHYILDYLVRINPYRKVISRMVILLFILSGASTAATRLNLGLKQAFLIFFLVIVIHLIMLGLAVVYARISGIDAESKAAVMLCSSQKTLPASLMIWSNYFSGYLLAPLILITYHVVQLFIDSIVVNYLNKVRAEN